MINNIMRLWEIIKEDATAGATSSGNIATVSFPLFGDEKMIRRSVDPKGHLGKKKKIRTPGYKYPVKVKGGY
jgi:hypothetical protein